MVINKISKKNTRRKNTRRNNTRRKNTRRKNTRRKNTRRNNTRRKNTRRKNIRYTNSKRYTRKRNASKIKGGALKFWKKSADKSQTPSRSSGPTLNTHLYKVLKSIDVSKLIDKAVAHNSRVEEHLSRYFDNIKKTDGVKLIEEIKEGIRRVPNNDKVKLTYSNIDYFKKKKGLSDKEIKIIQNKTIIRALVDIINVGRLEKLPEIYVRHVDRAARVAYDTRINGTGGVLEEFYKLYLTTIMLDKWRFFLLLSEKLQVTIAKFPNLSDVELSDEYIKTVSEYYCSTDNNVNILGDTDHLNNLKTQTDGNILIDNISNNLEKIFEFLSRNSAWYCIDYQLAGLDEYIIIEEILIHLGGNPKSNIYDWIESSKACNNNHQLSFDQGRLQLKRDGKHYTIATRLLFNEVGNASKYIKLWNKATSSSAPDKHITDEEIQVLFTAVKATKDISVIIADIKEYKKDKKDNQDNQGGEFYEWLANSKLYNNKALIRDYPDSIIIEMDKFYIHKTLLTLVAPLEYWNIVSDIEEYLVKNPEGNFYDWLANSELYDNQGLLDDFHDSLRTVAATVALELLTQSNIDNWNSIVPTDKHTSTLIPKPEGQAEG